MDGLTSSIDSTIDPVALFYAHFEALHFVSGLSNQSCRLVNSHSQSIIRSIHRLLENLLDERRKKGGRRHQLGGADKQTIRPFIGCSQAREGRENTLADLIMKT